MDRILSASRRLGRVFAITVGALLAAISLSGCTDDFAEQGRAVFKHNQQSVVTVQLTVKSKVSMGGTGAQSNDSRKDVTGTVIDPSGLTVVSLSATDPAQMLQNVMGTPEDSSKFKMETELSDVKLLLADGTELPAEVVSRDRDLDLAFLRPKAKLSSKLQAVDLAGSGTAQVLDQVIALSRLGNVASRAFAASVERVSAVVEQPRLFYIPEASLTSTPLGAPAFTLGGKILGLFVVRSTKASSSGGSQGLVNQRDNATGIILPAADILKAAKAAPAAGADQPNAENK